MDDEDEYITVEEAAEILRVSIRQAHRYGSGPEPPIRTRRAGQRTAFHRGDVLQLAEERGATRTPPPKRSGLELVPQSDLVDHLRETQQRLEQALLEIGRLRGVLEQRLLPEDEHALRDRLAEAEAERKILRAELEAERASRRAEENTRSRPWWLRILGG